METTFEMPESAKTLNEIYPFWLEDKKKYVKESSLSVYVNMYQLHVEPIFGKCKYVSREMADEQILIWIKEGSLSKKTIMDIFIIIKMMFKFASEKGWQPFYTFTIRFPKNYAAKERALKRFTKQQIEKLISHCEMNYNNRNLGILITAQTGMRIGEISGLKWSDINMETQTIRISRTILGSIIELLIVFSVLLLQKKLLLKSWYIKMEMKLMLICQIFLV